MNIRKATMEDAPGIGKVHVDSWQTTYKNIVSDRFLNQLSYDNRTNLWKRNISENEFHIVVAENEEGEIIGFASGKQEDSGNFPDYDGDITSIYLLDEYQGQGVGQKLLEAVFYQFRILGYNSAVVWVLKDNRSRHFYEKTGAEVLIDDQKVKIGGDQLDIMAYGWKDLSVGVKL
ncbi:GNAT family N-acetyltransferase [Filobacillus milosensis]|uniref:GNAT family N-acetyltransferase n=1 Tax=Filobacillus milosensis TaxID=94137 RepID=A0A4Y8IN83_9BACI|nr:GNAT family N-acetyltransferase [Filobacillus milosensis]TFB22877.1 GNAT family N-acetyltransferase [Filobacillus milosensis]